MSEFYELSPKALALAEESQSFQLKVPDSATKDRDGITDRWTDVVDIQAVGRGTNPAKQQQYFEVSVRMNGEGLPDNVGTDITRRFYINTEVVKDERRLRLKNRDDSQAGMTQFSLSRIGQLMRAAGLQGDEDRLWEIDSPLVGKKCWVELTQRPSRKADRAGKIDLEITRFLPYEG
jgi:hypothetical protein